MINYGERKCSTCKERVVPAANFMGTISANVDNEKMSDRHFRQFIRNTLPIVKYDPGVLPMYEEKPKDNSVGKVLKEMHGALWDAREACGESEDGMSNAVPGFKRFIRKLKGTIRSIEEMMDKMAVGRRTRESQKVPDSVS